MRTSTPAQSPIYVTPVSSRIKRIILAIWGVLLFSIASQASAATVLRVADTQPADYPTVIALEHMAERIAELTDGELLLKIHPARQLGEEKDTILATIFGAIDINRVSSAPLGTMVPELQILGLPYLFKNEAHFYRVLDGDIGEEILAFMRPHGLVGLGYLTAGARSFYSTRPIRTPADLAGMKVRVQNTDLYLDMVRYLGGNATPMSFGQVYESLVTGVIDAAENNWPSYVATRHFEAARYYTLDRHTMVPEVLMMSLDRWNSLTDSQQAIIKKAAREAELLMRKLWAERVEDVKRTAANARVEVIEPADLQAFADAVMPLYAPFKENPVYADLIARIRRAGEP